MLTASIFQLPFPAKLLFLLYDILDVGLVSESALENDSSRLLVCEAGYSSPGVYLQRRPSPPPNDTAVYPYNLYWKRSRRVVTAVGGTGKDN